MVVWKACGSVEWIVDEQVEKKEILQVEQMVDEKEFLQADNWAEKQVVYLVVQKVFQLVEMMAYYKVERQVEQSAFLQAAWKETVLVDSKVGMMA